VNNQEESYARTKCQVASPEDLLAAHEQHRLNTAADVARLVSDAEKIARLQSIGSVPTARPASHLAIPRSLCGKSRFDQLNGSLVSLFLHCG
jgi:hypothetical protein